MVVHHLQQYLQISMSSVHIQCYIQKNHSKNSHKIYRNTCPWGYYPVSYSSPCHAQWSVMKMSQVKVYLQQHWTSNFRIEVTTQCEDQFSSIVKTEFVTRSGTWPTILFSITWYHSPCFLVNIKHPEITKVVISIPSSHQINHLPLCVYTHLMTTSHARLATIHACALNVSKKYLQCTMNMGFFPIYDWLYYHFTNSTWHSCYNWSPFRFVILSTYVIIKQTI